MNSFSWKQTRSAGIILSVLFLIAACAPPFSRQALDQVDRSITFNEFQRDPDRFQGKSVMLGGVIINSRNTREVSFIEVVERPIGRRGRPADTDVSEGRFLIESAQFIDPEIYRPGRIITVIGEAAGGKIQPLGEMQYRYPVVKSRELHLWEPSAGPQIHFGVGIGIFHGY